MTAPVPANGNLITTIAAPYTTSTLRGTNSSSDYVISSNPNAYSLFGDFVQRGNNLVLTVVDPFANKVGAYTFPLLGSAEAIELLSRDNGTGPSTGIYKFYGPGDYRSNTVDTGIQVYGTNSNDTTYGLIGADKVSALYGGAGNDNLIGGNSKFTLFAGGSGSNTLISGSGTNRYKIETSDNGVDLIRGQIGNDVVQIHIPTTNLDWGFKRVGNDLTGFVTDADGNTSRFTIENQYTTGRVDSILIYANGFSTTGAAFAGGGLNNPGVGNYTGTAQFFVSGSESATFDLRDTTRATARVFTNEGNDVLFGGPITTRTFFYAGDGIDTYVVSGVMSNYSLNFGTATNLASGRALTYANLGQTGKANPDYLQNVERLQFADKSLALDIGPSQNAGSLYMLYKAAFNRAPDEGGMGYWLAQVDGGKNLVNDIAAGFVKAPEFVAKYGTNPTNAFYVDQLYLNVLGRPGEAGGVAYWNQELNSGARSKAEVLVQFATLPEGAALVANLIANGIPYQEWVG